MDRFVEMQTFCAVVDAGSFVGAAEALGLSKAATSRYVGELETRLGVRLLHRREMTEVPVEPVVGVLPNRAGVEHHHVGLGSSLSGLVFRLPTSEPAPGSVQAEFQICLPVPT